MFRQLKTVTNWFQNKRQTSKKKTLVWSDGSYPKSSNKHYARRSARSASTSQPKTARRLHPTISLDRIAGLHEKPAGPTISTASVQRPPLTPRNTNRRTYPSFNDDKNKLWDHMPSSPIAPPSSPSEDKVRFSILPTRFKARKSLEWACAKARADRQTAHDEDDDELLTIACRGDDGFGSLCEEMETDDETDTDPEVEEAVTPNGSATFSPAFDPLCKRKDSHLVVVPQGKENIDPHRTSFRDIISPKMWRRRWSCLASWGGDDQSRS